MTAPTHADPLLPPASDRGRIDRDGGDHADDAGSNGLAVFLLLAELGLLAAALGTAAAFSRLFTGWGFLGSLGVPVIACWGSSLLLRRARVPVGWAAVASAGLALVVLTWRFAPEGAIAGVIPTPGSWTALQAEMRQSFSDFSRLIAPVPATDGFLVVLAGILWVFGFFADTAAFRYRGPVQAVVPYVATFVASGILARDAGRTGAAFLFVGGLGAYAVTQRALQVSRRRWLRGESGRGSWAVAATGALVAVLALLAGLVLGPRLPGDTEAVVDLRTLGRGGGARTVVSPFVGVRTLLGDQSDQVVFTVESEVPTYWRLTSLERYDAGREHLDLALGSYKRVDGDLDAAPPQRVPVDEVSQRFRIDALGGLWLPAAFQPLAVDADIAVSYDAGSSSIIARDDSLEDGLDYTVESAVPQLDPPILSAAAGRPRVDPVYTEDPGLSPEVRDLARQKTEDAETPYLKALALQDWFRGPDFTYDTDVDYRDEADPVLAFISSGNGFCQQFASTFALMARSLGLPARVAVGFTQGDSVAQLPGTDSPGYVVRGRHAHAWPEIYFEGIGWVPFEPTSGRGNPQATTYTDVEAAQAEPPAAQATTTVPPTTAPADVPATATTLPTGQVDATSGPDATTDDGTGDRSPWWILPVLAAVLVAALVGLRAGRRAVRRRRVGADPDGGRIALAWDDVIGWLAVVGIPVRPEETPLELAARLRDDERLGGLATQVERLAGAETARRFGRTVPSDEWAAEAETDAAAIVEQLRTVATRRQQVQHLVGS